MQLQRAMAAEAEAAREARAKVILMLINDDQYNCHVETRIKMFSVIVKMQHIEKLHKS